MNGTLLPVELGDGLILRQATTDDVDALVAFNTMIFGEDDEQAQATAASAADLLGKRHPHPRSSADLFTLVEDTASGAIVSSLCMIPQTWRYGSVEIPSTLIEYVGTKPEYRGRGLIRRQFDVVHAWCTQRGILIQGIAGIPWYYRQFGYEYAIGFGPGRSAQRSRLPKLEGNEPLRIRKAEVEDAAFIAELDARNQRRWLVTNVRNEALWRYEIAGRHPDSDAYVHVQVIGRHDGAPVGYVAYAVLPGNPPWIASFEVADSASWLDTVPVVLRHLLEVDNERQEEVYAHLELGADHPAYDAMPDVLTPFGKTFNMYVRINDLPGFLMLIAPVLEQRLAVSVAHGYSGELPINLYRSGIRLLFEAGRLTSVTSERMASTVAASLPDLTILQLIFGHRSLAELDDWYPDCRIRTTEARVLLDVLFPRQSSLVWPLW